MNLLRGCVWIMSVWKIILSVLVHKLAQATEKRKDWHEFYKKMFNRNALHKLKVVTKLI